MTQIITAPFAWVMRLFYTLTGSYGVSVLLFSLVVKLVMLPFQMKSKRSMVRMGRLTKQQKELEKKYANNKMKYQEELQKLYTEAGVNPMGGCLWSLIPLAILIPLYNIIRMPMQYFMGLGTEVIESIETLAVSLGYDVTQAASGTGQIHLAQFVHDHWDSFQGKFDGLMNVDFHFLKIDLAATPWSGVTDFHFELATIGLILIPVISGVLSFLQTHVTMKSNGQTEQMSQMRTMNILMPLMSVYIGFILPAALGLYWIANSVFAIIQEATLGKYYNNKIQAEEDERERKRETLRQLRMEEAKRQAQEQRDNPRPKKQEKKPEKKQNPTNEAGRVGERPYARGRSYVENRYDER